MNNILKRLLKTVLFTALLFYSCIVIAQQEVSFNKYDKQLAEYNEYIQEEDLKNEQLKSIRDRIKTEEYIEEVAREKLGLVMPNETVFIDANL